MTYKETKRIMGKGEMKGEYLLTRTIYKLQEDL
jgi:hypothetical protein